MTNLPLLTQQYLCTLSCMNLWTWADPGVCGGGWGHTSMEVLCAFICWQCRDDQSTIYEVLYMNKYYWRRDGLYVWGFTPGEGVLEFFLTHMVSGGYRFGGGQFFRSWWKRGSVIFLVKKMGVVNLNWQENSRKMRDFCPNTSDFDIKPHGKLLARDRVSCKMEKVIWFSEIWGIYFLNLLKNGGGE